MGETARRMAGPAFGPTYADALFDRWLDFESGRWTQPPPNEGEQLERYFGAN